MPALEHFKGKHLDKLWWRKSPLKYTILTPNLRFLSHPSTSSTILALLFSNPTHSISLGQLWSNLCALPMAPLTIKGHNSWWHATQIAFPAFCAYITTLSAWLALLRLPGRYRKLEHQSTHHSPEDWKLNAICLEHLQSPAYWDSVCLLLNSTNRKEKVES